MIDEIFISIGYICKIAAMIFGYYCLYKILKVAFRPEVEIEGLTDKQKELEE